MVNFTALKNIYNNQMDMLLAQTGLSTECVLNFGTTKKNVCSNCIFDVNLKKSANKYKSGGPVPFTLGQLCPYCNGIGYYGEIDNETVYLAIIWDYKKWINPPPFNTAIPDGMIQTICDKTYLASIRQCKDMSVVYPSGSNKSHTFQLVGEPNPAGLGDNNYLISMWKKTN
jgi:hypothetical protein